MIAKDLLLMYMAKSIHFGVSHATTFSSCTWFYLLSQYIIKYIM